MDVGPAHQPRSPLVFQVGTEAHFPRLERFPTKTCKIIIVIPILKVKQLSHRKIEYLAQGHTAE